MAADERGTTAVRGLLERDGELEQIDAALAEACRGHGAAVLIEGAAGIGKTALIEAARRMARDLGMSVLHGCGTDFERDYALGVVRQCLQAAVHSATAQQRERLLSGPAANAAPVVLDGVDPADSSTPFGMLHALYWLVANLTADAPALVVVDDAHWADDASLRFLAFLVRRAESLPVAVLLACRPDDQLLRGGALAQARADPALQVLLPRALSEAAVTTLLDTDGSGVAGDFARACHAVTGGNPFLLSHLTAALREHDVPFDGDAAGRVAQITPPEVARSVRRTLARSEPEAIRVAHAVAILGDAAALAEVAALAGLGRVATGEAAAALAAASLLADDRPLRFRHPLLRHATTAAMSAAERDQGHRRAAQLLADRGAPVERQAMHLRLVEPDASPEVAAVLRSAAQRASDRGAPEPAASLLERALAEPPPDALRHEFLFELGRAEYAAGRPERAGEHAAQAHRLAPDPAARVRALDLWGAASRPDLDRMAALAPLVDRVLAEIGDDDPELALQVRAHGLETALVSPPNPQRFARLAHGARDLRGDTPGEAAVLGLYILHRAREEDATAAEIGELAVRAARQADWFNAKGPDVLAFAGVMFALRWCDRLELAQRLLVDAIEHARRNGNAPSFVLAAVGLAETCRRAGMLIEAESDARAGVDAGPDWTVAQAKGAVAACLLDQGHVAQAWQELVEGGLTGTIGLAPPLTDILLTRMRVRAAAGQTEAALADWREALARPVGAPRVAWTQSYVVAAEVLKAAGEPRAAAALGEQALDQATRWGTSGAIDEALCGLARTGGGDDAIELLRTAVTHLERSPARLVQARALVDLGAALRRCGDRRVAREPLNAGLELAYACGADGLAETARQELAASGVRVLAPQRGGAQLLTASERRIAHLAAGGATNAEIAQSLFVTVKTVEMHLTSSYRKLDIAKRSQLADALQRGE